MFFVFWKSPHSHGGGGYGMARWMSTDLFAGKHQRSRLLIAERQRMIKKIPSASTDARSKTPEEQKVRLGK
jgi:hypothetical protein